MRKKILVIRFSSIGDIVLTTPVVRALHRQLDAEVHYLTKSAFAPIMHGNPHIAAVHILQDDFGAMMDTLRRERFDHIVDLHHNLRTRRIRLTLGKPASSFQKLNIEKWLLVRFGINLLPGVHIVDRYMAAAAELGVQNDGEGLDFFIPAEKKVDVRNRYGFAPGDYLSIVIGAAHQTKCLTAEQILQVCEKNRRPVILLGGKNEAAKGGIITNAVKNTTVKNACGALDILQSASVLEQSGAILTHDTGLMHIAAALKKPQVVVWGNTVPAFGMYPYYGNADIKWHSFEVGDLRCRPCSKLGYQQCPKGHFKCIMEQDMDGVAGALE